MENAIYVGKYKIPKHGMIKLPNSKIGVFSFYIGVDKHGRGWLEDKLTLVVEDGTFLPVICKLTDKEAKKLIKALQDVLKHRQQEENQYDQLRVYVTGEE